MIQSRYANLMIDVVSRLASPQSPAAKWAAVRDIAFQLGANGLTAGAVDLATRQPIWVRYDMNPDWLDEYTEDGLYKVDKILSGALNGRVKNVFEAKDVVSAHRDSAVSRQFQAGLKRSGMNFFTCRGRMTNGVYKVVTLPSERDPQDLFGPGTAKALDTVATLMIDALEVPDGAAKVPWQGQRNALYQTERDVISWMAHGLSCEEIAIRLKLDISVVHIHMQQACKKLGADTYPQAVATALSRGLLSL